MSRYRGSHLRLNWTKPPSGSGQWEARLHHYVLMVSGGPRTGYRWKVYESHPVYCFKVYSRGGAETSALAKRAAEHAVARELGWERL